jgi:MFS family permease
MLFVVSAVNYADRATLSIAGSEVSRQLGLSKVVMGYAFSAFGWAYVLGQIPGGWLLDRFGSKRVYLWSIVTWSFFTFLQGFVGYFEAATAVVLLFALRFLLGLAEAPLVPRQRPDRGGMVPDGGARHGVGDLQSPPSTSRPRCSLRSPAGSHIGSAGPTCSS